MCAWMFRDKERSGDGGDLSDDDQKLEVETEDMKARRELVEVRLSRGLKRSFFHPIVHQRYVSSS